MATRIPASQRTREELTALIEGRLSTASAKDELVKLATRLIFEEALEGEAGDAIGRDYYEHGAARPGLPEWVPAGATEDSGRRDGILGAADRRAGRALSFGHP